jgi:glycosyltransferase involved in cell wall biosynthesis
VVVTTQQEATLVSVVMPVYNEAAILADVVRDVQKHVLDEVAGSELVVVDDRSTDETPAVLAAAAAGDDRIRVLRNESNIGHGPSVRRGIDAARGRWIFHLDSDGQVDVSEFERLWACRTDADLVVGVRVDRHDPTSRLVLTALTRWFVSALARTRLRDANAPFKLISRPLVDHLRPAIPADAFAPSILLVLGAHRCGAAVREVGISHFARPHGRSTLHLWRLVRAAARSGMQTVRFVRRPLAPYRRPADGTV